VRACQRPIIVRSSIHAHGARKPRDIASLLDE
jgi:hypothetical protein